MADVILSAELQAKVDAFVNNLLKAANGADKTSSSVGQMSVNISKNIANVNRLNLNQFNSALNSGTLSINKLNTAASNIRPTINRAGTDFQGFSRVLQDAAFGPAAIANNLSEAARDITNLGKIAKESGQSIGRVLVNSLTGPGGINLALGGFTLALSLASFGLSAWTRLFPSNKKALEDSKKASDDYADSLDAVAGAELRGAQNAAKEISVLNTLFNIYQNSNIPLNKRKEAYTDIQRLYPDYFKNIKFENELTGSSRVAYDKLTQSIISSAKAKALSAKIGENSVKEEEIATKIFNLSEDLKKSRNSDTSYAKALGGSKETQDILEQIYALDTERLKLKADDLRLQDKLNEKVKEGASIANNFASPGGAINNEKKLEIPISPKLELPENPKQIFEDLFSKLNAINISGDPLQVKAPKIEFTDKVDIGDAIDFDPEKLAARIKELDIESKVFKRIEETQKKLSEFFSFDNVNSGIAEGLGSAFESIGTAFANGTSVIDAAGASILGAIGSILIKFGSLTLAAGIAATALGKALSNPLNPASAGAAIAAGAALIAIGAAVSAFSKNIGQGGNGGSYEGVKPIRGFAAGGNNVPGGLAIVGERGPELVNLPTGASVYTNQRSMDMLSGMGGNDIVIGTRVSVSMRELVFAIDKERKLINNQG